MNSIYIGIAGHVASIDSTTGEENWRTKIKSAGSITNIVLDGDKIIAYTSGHLFALAPATGDILWENSLKGLGYSTCIIAGSQQTATAQGAATQGAAAAAVVATTATTSTAS